MNNHYYCVIMAGGIGSRFWPVSREARPKQFLPLSRNGKSFLRLAYERFSGIIPSDHILVVTQYRYRELARNELPEVLEDNFIYEPYSRNTAPCIALAAYTLLKRDPEAVMIATPADHIILNEDIFKETIENALEYASSHDALITLGIVPTRPDTNFGYIQGVFGQNPEQGRPIKVKTFTEKPDAELAKVFIQSGEFYWNSGIFVWRAQTIREELEKYMPEVRSLFKGWETALGSDDPSFVEKIYTSILKISIDYAVMEKTSKAWVYPSTFGWYDIGNWESLYGYMSQTDKDRNAIIAGPSLNRGCSDNIVFSSNKKKLMAVSGLDNYIIVDTDDVLMICPRDDNQIKDIIANIAMPEYEKYR